MVLTTRDGGVVQPGWPVTVCELAPLTADQSDELIVALDATVTEQQRAQIRNRCDGVPFYHRAGGGRTARPPRQRRPRPGAAVRAAASPDCAEAPPWCVAEAAAVIGRHGDRSLLAVVVGLDTGQLDRVIDELEDARVGFEPHGSTGWGVPPRTSPREASPPNSLHLASRAACTPGPPTRLRPRRRRRPGLAPGGRPLRTRGTSRRCRAAYRCACAAAQRRGGSRRARAYLDRAVSQLEHHPPASERDHREVDARLQRGYLAVAAAEPEGNLGPVSIADFERCLQLCGTDLRDNQVVATFIAAVAHYMWAANLRRAAELVDACCGAAPIPIGHG